MDKFKVISPENIEIEYTRAGLGARAAAVMIDYLIQWVIQLILVGGIIFAVFKTDRAYLEENFGWAIGIFLIIFWGINYLYFIIFESTMNGATPGKRVLKLRTIRNNGMPITLKHSLVRNLFRVIIDNYFVGIIMMFFRKDKKRLGDIVSSTVVVGEGEEVLAYNNNLFANETPDSNIFITEEEKDIIRDYFNRKEELGEHKDKVLNDLMTYFKKHYEFPDDGYSFEEKMKKLL
ncbi:RDD family protein [Oceanirhabdus sp. W0125-5]|uniref:RDD family protein n=1 Tax=Oceanirhabdus sp. W0125-5 TaxID=2999116 RepID=UPI0022F2D3C7|nr:RDD family protein [Oceanirhabdus sp. W0125-5]WBW95966.1 RDD family protein [Oceanirhabdus sp. W0125-5]